MPETKPQNLLTIAQVAEQLQCSRRTIWRMIARGELRAYRYGARVVRIKERDLERLRRPVTSTADYREALARGGAA